MSREIQFDAAFAASTVAAYIEEEDAFIYNANKRPRRGLIWTIAYCLFAALTLAGSVPVFLRTDPDTGLYSNRFFNNSTSCNVKRYQEVAWMYNDSTYDPTFLMRFKVQIAIWIPATGGLALLWSALYLFLFSRFPRIMLGVMTLGSLVVGGGLSMLCIKSGTAARSVGIALAACTVVAFGLFLWLFRWGRMYAELMAIGAQSLRKNRWLVPAALGIKLVGLLILAYGFAAFFSSINYGYVSRNWSALKRVALADENGFCENNTKMRVPCCIFVTYTLPLAYSAVAAVFVVWSGALLLQLKTFTAADVMAQWYLAAGTASSTYTVATDGIQFDSFASNSAADASVGNALRHGLMASFGTLAAAAVLLAPLRAIRWMCQGLLHAKYIGRATSCIVRPLLSATEKFTRFSTIAAGITGQAFLPAARAAYELLQRNFMAPYGLWWIPPVLSQISSALLALSWAGVVFLATYSTNKQYKPIVGSVSLATAGTAFFLIFYGLLFTAGLQMDIVHTLYICYAMDKDRRRVTHPAIHAVIRKVPGQSVQQHRSALIYEVQETEPAATSDMAATAAGATVTAEAAATADSAPLPPPLGSNTAEENPRPSAFGSGMPTLLKRRAL